MRKPDAYKVIREYDNQYGLEELVRRIVRCHLTDGRWERAGAKFSECTSVRGSELLIGSGNHVRKY